MSWEKLVSFHRWCYQSTQYSSSSTAFSWTKYLLHKMSKQILCEGFFQIGLTLQSKSWLAAVSHQYSQHILISKPFRSKPWTILYMHKNVSIPLAILWDRVELSDTADQRLVKIWMSAECLPWVLTQPPLLKCPNSREHKTGATEERLHSVKVEHGIPVFCLHQPTKPT